MQIIVVQSGLDVTAIATTIIGIHTYMIYAPKPTYFYGYELVLRTAMHTTHSTYIHTYSTCATAKL